MKVTLEKGEIVIRIPANEKPYTPSKSGKTLTIAGTEGFTKTDLMIDGKAASVNLHVCIKV